MKVVRGGLLLTALLVLATLASGSSRTRSNNNDDNYADNNNQQQGPKQQAKPFEAGQQYIYAYDGQIATGLDTNGVELGQPQQKAVSRIQAQAQITFQSGGQATLRLQQTRIGQLNKHIEQPEQVQPMLMFETKRVHDEQARQLALPVRFDYTKGLVSNVQFHPEDRSWAKNVKRSVLNLIQLNIQDASQRQKQESWEQSSEEQDDQTKTFAVQETTIEGDCQTIYTINKNKKGGNQQEQSSEEQGSAQQDQPKSFNVTKAVDFKQCKKIADVAHGYQTEQEQPECAKCRKQWQKQLKENRQSTKQLPAQQHCAQCDPKEIKKEKLDRSTVLRFTLNGHSQKFGIQRAELVSQYVYKSLRAQNSPYSASLQAIASAQLVFQRSQQPKENDQQQEQELRKLEASPKAKTLLYDNEWDVDEKRFYMEGDEVFGRNSPFANVQNKVGQAQQIIRRLVTAAADKQNGVEFEQVVQLQRMVELFRMCSVDELEAIMKIMEAEDGEQKSTSLHSLEDRRKAQQIITDSLAIAGTRNTIFVLAKKITNAQLDKVLAVQSLKALTGLVAPSDKQVDIILSLCQSDYVQRSGPLKQTCWLTFSSMVGELCLKEQRKGSSQSNNNNNNNNNNDNDDDEQGQQRAFGSQTGFQPKQPMCQGQKKESYKQALIEEFNKAKSTYEKLLALKALGNAGIDTSVREIEQVIKDRRGNPMVRCQAIDSVRRLRTQMPRKIQRSLLPIFQNAKEQPIVRMCAFHIIMQTQPESAILDHVTYALIKERHPDVQAFVYSGMKALSKSKIPAQQQMAQHLKNALKLVNIDEQTLRKGGKFNLPFYSEMDKEGLFLNTATISSDGRTGMLPNYMVASLDSLLNDQHELSQLRVAFSQSNIEQWYEQLMRALSNVGNQRRGASRSERRSSDSGFGRYDDPMERINRVQKALSIKRRGQSGNNQRSNEQTGNSNEQDQEEWIDQQPFAMFYVRIGDVDQAIIPLDHTTAPRPIKSLLNGEQPNLRELIDALSERRPFSILTAMSLNEKTAKIPTSIGLPLRVQQSMPLMLSIEGEAKANSNDGRIEAKVMVHPSLCVAFVQKMESWMPIMTTGVVTTQAIEMSAPINAELTTGTDKGVKLTLKVPDVPKTRLFGLHSLPTTYTADWDASNKMQREPRVRAIHNQQLEQLQQEVDKRIGEHTTGMIFRVNGHYHMPASVSDYKQTMQLLMASENHLHVTFEPTDATPKKVVLSASAGAFQRASDQSEHAPELNTFYGNERPSFDRDAHEDDNFGDMDNQQQSRRKLTNFLSSYKAGPVYEHKLTLSAETQGGRKECRAEVRVKAGCDAPFKFCKASVNVQRSAMYADESRQWTMSSKVQMLCPESVKNAQELAQLEGMNAKFIVQAETEWGSDEKQEVRLRVQGQQAKPEQKESSYESTVEKNYQQKQRAFINKYDMVAEYTLNKYTQNTANRALEMLKAYYFWNSQSQSKHNGEGQMQATLVIDPFTQNHANISVKTPSESVRIQSIRLPTSIRPFPLVRRADKPMHTTRQFIQHVAGGDQRRAECTISGQQVDTFDGTSFTAPLGPCYSVVAKDCRSIKPRFVVMVKTLDRDGSNQNKKVLVLSKEKVIECQPKKDNDGGKTKLQCSIDGQPVSNNNNNNNYDSSNQQSESARNNNQNSNGKPVVEYEDNEQTEVKINIDNVQVQLACWCKSCKCQKVTVKISRAYKEAQCGLCGHYDDDGGENDLRKADNQLTENLADFHRSYSFVDDDCSTADNQRFYEEKKLSFKSRGRTSQIRMRKHTIDGEDGESAQQDAEWRAGNYASDESDSSEELESKTRRSKYSKQRQQNNKQQRKGGMRNEPTGQTKVVEYNHKVCFSTQPVKQCPQGTADPDEGKSDADPKQQKRVSFVCMPRSSAETRRMLREARERGILEVPNRAQPAFIDQIREPTRCVAY